MSYMIEVAFAVRQSPRAVRKAVMIQRINYRFTERRNEILTDVKTGVQ